MCGELHPAVQSTDIRKAPGLRAAMALELDEVRKKPLLESLGLQSVRCNLHELCPKLLTRGLHWEYKAITRSS